MINFLGDALPLVLFMAGSIFGIAVGYAGGYAEGQKHGFIRGKIVGRSQNEHR